MQRNLDFMHELNLYRASSINNAEPSSGGASCSAARLATGPTSITAFSRHTSPVAETCYHCPPSLWSSLFFFFFLNLQQLFYDFCCQTFKAAAPKLEEDVPAALIGVTETPQKKKKKKTLWLPQHEVNRRDYTPSSGHRMQRCSAIFNLFSVCVRFSEKILHCFPWEHRKKINFLWSDKTKYIDNLVSTYFKQSVCSMEMGKSDIQPLILIFLQEHWS